ncbi:TerC family protein [Ilyomonas limi]|uniref:TerC family protein n=1 Tax=Ilyomonas limi TaxID=2575867 RepID=A0A4U3L927_9BACT|nr:TerC family protein [Ilyomonas limi]TKK71788.1 TerC family protein [Ilyomonas limi]
MNNLFSADNIVSFFVLVILEIVLGIDNVIFVSIIISRMQSSLQRKARFVWMIAGIIVRSVLLFGLTWLLAQKGKYIIPESWFGKGFDLASLVMLAGGLFLIYKTVKEIHHKLEGDDEHVAGGARQLSFGRGVMQIILIDMVFSFDSIITAGGTAKRVEIMIAAVIIAMIIMFLFSPKIAAFIDKHPTIKMLALSFLVMIGFILLVEGFASEAAESLHLKNYVYFAMFFSFLVELLNMRLRKKQGKPVHLHQPDRSEIKK